MPRHFQGNTPRRIAAFYALEPAVPDAQTPYAKRRAGQQPCKAHFDLWTLSEGGYTRRRRRGRVVEGTPLLRAHTGNGIEGSNPFVSAIPDPPKM